MSQLIAG